jgi:excisionase family DNA binding protein
LGDPNFSFWPPQALKTTKRFATYIIANRMNDLIVISKDELGRMIRASLKEVLSEEKSRQPQTFDKFLDLKEAAEFLKLKVTTIYGYTSQSQIPFIKRGKKLYFEKSKLEAWLKECKQESIAEIRKRLGGQ